MKGLRKVGKVLNTDVGKLARSAKRGLAKRKVKKIRQDRYAAKAARGLRDKAGFGKYREQAGFVKKNPTKKQRRENWKKWSKGEKVYNQRGGVTKGMSKAEDRVTDRRRARMVRKDKIAKKKAKASKKIDRIATKNRKKVEYINAKRRGRIAQQGGPKGGPKRGGSLPEGTKKAIAKKKAQRPQANKSQIAAAKRNRNIAQGKKDYRKGMTTAQYAASLKNED